VRRPRQLDVSPQEGDEVARVGQPRARHQRPARRGPARPGLRDVTSRAPPPPSRSSGSAAEFWRGRDYFLDKRIRDKALREAATVDPGDYQLQDLPGDQSRG